jgi:hypothetical protein
MFSPMAFNVSNSSSSDDTWPRNPVMHPPLEGVIQGAAAEELSVCGLPPELLRSIMELMITMRDFLSVMYFGGTCKAAYEIKEKFLKTYQEEKLNLLEMLHFTEPKFLPIAMDNFDNYTFIGEGSFSGKAGFFFLSEYFGNDIYYFDKRECKFIPVAHSYQLKDYGIVPTSRGLFFIDPEAIQVTRSIDPYQISTSKSAVFGYFVDNDILYYCVAQKKKMKGLGPDDLVLSYYEVDLRTDDLKSQPSEKLKTYIESFALTQLRERLETLYVQHSFISLRKKQFFAGGGYLYLNKLFKEDPLLIAPLFGTAKRIHLPNPSVMAADENWMVVSCDSIHKQLAVLKKGDKEIRYIANAYDQGVPRFFLDNGFLICIYPINYFFNNQGPRLKIIHLETLKELEFSSNTLDFDTVTAEDIEWQTYSILHAWIEFSYSKGHLALHIAGMDKANQKASLRSYHAQDAIRPAAPPELPSTTTTPSNPQTQPKKPRIRLRQTRAPVYAWGPPPTQKAPLPPGVVKEKIEVETIPDVMGPVAKTRIARINFVISAAFFCLAIVGTAVLFGLASSKVPSLIALRATFTASGATVLGVSVVLAIAFCIIGSTFKPKHRTIPYENLL